MELKGFFKEHPKVAIAFSGGVDSSYLLYMAKQYASEVCAYFVKTQFQPEFELQDAKKLSEQLGIQLHILNYDVLQHEEIIENPENRCYFCKRRIFTQILKVAKEDGFFDILDGTNASDQVDNRPGMKVLEELKVFSPLRLCELTKGEIRRLSKEAGLFTFDKPSYACLATRIPAGTRITDLDLRKVERAESYLENLGFSDFRVRVRGKLALLQLPKEQMDRAIKLKQEILSELGQAFDEIALDLKNR